MSKSSTETPWRPERIVVGRIGRPHGLDGAAYVDGHGGAVPLRKGLQVSIAGRPAVISERRGADARPIVRLDIAPDRTAVEALRGADIEVDCAALPEPADEDDYLHVDLVGCRVAAGDRDLGEVTAVLVYPANDVLEVRRPDGEVVLVPFAADVVSRVDVPGRRIAIRDDFL
jgi:16S rRNA processing protein RimM